MYRVVSTEKISTEKWEAYIDKHPKALYFHSPFFLNSINTTINYRGFVYFVIDSSDNIMGLLLGYIHTVKRGILSSISKRIVIPQIPLYENENALKFLLSSYTKSLGNSAIYTELRCHSHDPLFHKIALEQGLIFKAHLNSIVDCKSHDNTWSSISESRRRQIKKALKSGVQVIEDPTEEQVMGFYEILSALYKNIVKKPLIQLDYFFSLYHDSSSTSFYTIFLLVAFENKIIGGIVAPISKNSFIHEHYIAGLDHEFKNQYPSVIATWAAIDYAIKNNIEYFDFMGAGKPEEEYGVRDFKLRFGGTLTEPGRYEFVPNKILYSVATKGFRLLASIKGKSK